MEVITLNRKELASKSRILYDKISENSDLVVCIQNGGGYLLDFMNENGYFEDKHILKIKKRRSLSIKKNAIAQIIIRYLPCSLSNFLREWEYRNFKKIKSRQSSNYFEVDTNTLNKIPANSIKTILIIDDALDTGQTMELIIRKLNELFESVEIKIAVISWTMEDSIVQPDYYVFKNVLVRFPWSLDYKGKDFEK